MGAHDLVACWLCYARTCNEAAEGHDQLVWGLYPVRVALTCPTCGDWLITVPNDDPAYGAPELYFCETAGAAHIPFGWTPNDAVRADEWDSDEL